MRFRLALYLLISAFTGMGTAQDSTAATDALTEFIAAFPNCALACLTSAVAASTCDLTDVPCVCADEALTARAEVCVLQSCTVVESLTAKNLTQTLCGVPVRDKSFTYNAASCVLIVVSGVFVLVRLGYTKFFSMNSLGLDDLFILLTLLNCVPAAIINTEILTRNGLGKDIWTLTADQITNFARGFWIITLLYFSEVYVLKLALLFFYLRIFPKPLIRRLLWGTVVFNVVFGLSFIIAAVFQCWPISYNWTSWRGEGGGTCVNISAIAWANAAVSISLDLWMLALPLSQLRELKLHWKKKVGVVLMFCVGTFVTVVSIIRLASLVEFRGSTNLTWDYWGVSLWSTVEITIGIICACMPAMRLILIRVAPKIFGSTLGRRGTDYYAGKNSNGESYQRSAARTDLDISINRKTTRFSVKSTPRDASRFSRGPPHDLDDISDEIDLVPLEHKFPRGASTVIISSAGNSGRSSSKRRPNERDTPSPV
ncbi:hypothetical protein F4809DRAFT_616535 [Biscogniauxia mediterranea]|nr:hypothetical protein F4809DRAFT_616535 [Biscogniauxia mediterranea]